MAKKQDFGLRIERLRQRYGDPTEELHAAYSPWLEEQAARPGSKLTPFEFDPQKHPEQRVYEPKTPAEDRFAFIPDGLFYKLFERKMAASLGKTSLKRLLREMDDQPTSSQDPTPLPVRLKEDQKAGKNTLVVTSHFTFPEFGYFRGLRFVAERDRPNINRSGVVMNKLMTRQNYRGQKLVNHFKPLGSVYWSYPKSVSATRHNIPADAMNLGNALFTMAIEPDLEKGGLELDVALTGSEVKPISGESGEFSHYQIPDIDPASVKLLERFDNVFGATLIKDPEDDEWKMEIGELLDIKDLLKTNSGAQITDLVYSGIVSAIEKITRKDTVYNKLAPATGEKTLRAAAGSD